MTMRLSPIPAIPQGEEAQTGRRPIRSFVLREGRLTPGQRRAFGRLWPRFGLADRGPLDPPTLFGRRAPLELEIGFGNGEALATLARARPGHDFIGVEVHRPGIGRLLATLEREGLDNVRVLRQDALEALPRLPPASLQRLHLYFPDPWPKQRHHKRRIVQAPFVDAVARVLAPGGELRLATDWADYAHWMRAVLDPDPRFRNLGTHGGFAPRPAERPLTRFERRGQGLGHEVFDLAYRRE